MPRRQRSLLAALIASLLLHAAALVGRPPPAATPSPAPPPLQAVLQAATLPPEAPPPAPPELAVDDAPAAPEKAEAARPKPVGKPAKSAVDRKAAVKTWQRELREQVVAQRQQGLCYPAAAIRGGLQGEVSVLVILDGTGLVSASRIEASSGHALLDEAALCAVRRLRPLPDDAPREFVLPVRFVIR